MLILSTCSGSPASSFPGLRKAGRGAGNEATHSLASYPGPKASGLGTRLPGYEATHSSGLTGESCYVSTRA